MGKELRISWRPSNFSRLKRNITIAAEMANWSTPAESGERRCLFRCSLDDSNLCNVVPVVQFNARKYQTEGFQTIEHLRRAIVFRFAVDFSQ